MSKHISQNFHQQTRRPSSTFLEPATPSKNWGLRRRVLEHRTFGDGRRVRRQTQYGDEAERDMLRRGWDGRRSSLSDEKDGDEEEFDIGNEAVTKKGRVVEQTSSSLTAMGGLLRRVKKRVANLRKNAEDDHETNPEEINDDEDEEWHAPDVKEARVEIEALSENCKYIHRTSFSSTTNRLID